MTDTDIVIDEVSWNLNLDTLLDIRGRVFIEEQGVPEAIERDDQDAAATHFLVTRNSAAVACGRLLPDGKVGRMAVLPEFRGHGMGRRLLDHIVGHARRRGMQRLYLHAQDQAADFYLKSGFEVEGEPFQEAGITHLAMAMAIDFRDADCFITGVNYPQPFATLAVALAAGARRHLRIYSHALDHQVFDNPDLSAAITALVRRGRQSEIRILVNDARSMVSRGHRLLQLSRRLSSTISIRVLNEHPELPEACYVVRDGNGILYKPDERGANGFYEPDSRASARRFVESFDALWRLGQYDPRLRQLTL